MRNVISTVTSVDVDEDYAEAVEGMLTGLVAQRETTQVDRYGQSAFRVRVVTYPAPGSGETVWAVDYADPPP